MARGGEGGGGVVSTCTPHHSQVTNWVHNLRRAGSGSPRRQQRATASEGRAHQKNRASLRGGRTRACTFGHNKAANNRSKCKWDRVHVPLWHSCILLHTWSATRAATCPATCICSAFSRYIWRYIACSGPLHMVQRTATHRVATDVRVFWGGVAGSGNARTGTFIV